MIGEARDATAVATKDGRATTVAPARWQKFWFVWGWRGEKSSGDPRFRHETMASAIAEAKRLATAHPHQPFIVLSAKCLVRVPSNSKSRRPFVRWFKNQEASEEAALQIEHGDERTLTECNPVPVDAAAPDLYDALKGLLGMYGPSTEYDDKAREAWKFAEDAIRKAEGR